MTKPGRKATWVAALGAVCVSCLGASMARGQSVALVDAEGVQALIAQHRGRVAIVNFWATWCPPCVKEFPDIIAVYEGSREHGLAVIPVSMNAEDELEDIDEFLQRFTPPFPVYRAAAVDEDFYRAIVQPWFGELPITLIYDKSGELVHYHRRAVTRDELASEVKALLDD